MSIKINYNVSAMLANNSLKTNDNKLSDSLARLSSGYKVNRAKDNAAGLAMARRMNAQINGVNIASDEAKDGVSVVEIADGALSECHDILQRINELCVKSANGSLTDDDRSVIQSEVNQLTDELVRIGKTTEFNGQPLLDGTYDLRGYVKDDNNIKINYYSDYVPIGKYDIELNALSATEYEMKMTHQGNGKETLLKGTFENGQLVAQGENGYEVRLELRDGHGTSFEANFTGYGAMSIPIGANEGQTIDIRIPELSLLNLSIGNTEGESILKLGPEGVPEAGVDYAEESKKAIGLVNKAISFVSEMRSRLGAYQNRLEHTENSLAVTEENLTAAYSRIMDTDMAEEMSKYTNLNVISQAATAMLAQANERPSQMLQLIQ